MSLDVCVDGFTFRGGLDYDLAVVCSAAMVRLGFGLLARLCLGVCSGCFGVVRVLGFGAFLLLTWFGLMVAYFCYGILMCLVVVWAFPASSGGLVCCCWWIGGYIANVFLVGFWVYVNLSGWCDIALLVFGFLWCLFGSAVAGGVCCSCCVLGNMGFLLLGCWCGCWWFWVIWFCFGVGSLFCCSYCWFGWFTSRVVCG